VVCSGVGVSRWNDSFDEVGVLQSGRMRLAMLGVSLADDVVTRTSSRCESRPPIRPSVLGGLTKEVKEEGPDGQETVKVVPAMTDEVKDALIKNIRRRMTPQPLKIRADIELKCFQYDGVLHIKDAMRRAEEAGTQECPVKIKLVAPPLYVLTTQTLEKELGISVLDSAIKACVKEIEKHKGKLTVKEPPRAVSERDDRLLAETMQKLGDSNQDVDGDADSEEEEDQGMGTGDLDGAGLVEL
jgi:translation initiation factor 2 subunit 1